MNAKFLKSICASFAVLLLMSGYSTASFNTDESSKIKGCRPVHRVGAGVPFDSGDTVGSAHVAGKPSDANRLHLSMRSAIHESGKRPIREKWALVVGISKFRDADLNLKYPAKDAKDFRDYLISDGHFKPDHIRLLLNEQATRRNILSLLADNWLPRVAHKDDLVLVFISSHGSASDLDVAGLNYILSHDSDLESLFATAIPLPQLSQIKKRIPSDRVVFVLDACNSGAAVAPVLITSSSSSESSWESKRYENSVFTRRLIEALKSNGDKTNMLDAFEVLRTKVSDEVMKDRGVKQTPVLQNKLADHDLILAEPAS